MVAAVAGITGTLYPLDDAGNDDADQPDEEDAHQCYPEGGPPVERTALLEEFRLSPLDDQGEYYPDHNNRDDH